MEWRKFSFLKVIVLPESIRCGAASAYPLAGVYRFAVLANFEIETRRGSAPAIPYVRNGLARLDPFANILQQILIVPIEDSGIRHRARQS